MVHLVYSADMKQNGVVLFCFLYLSPVSLFIEDGYIQTNCKVEMVRSKCRKVERSKGRNGAVKSVQLRYGPDKYPKGLN